MVAVPSDTPDTVSVDWSTDTDTVAAASSDEEAVMVRVSSSASLNTPESETSCVASTSSALTSAMDDAATGADFTVTAKVSDTSPPLPSKAVTVMFAAPRLLAVNVSVESSDATDTVATLSSDDSAVTVRSSPSANTPDRETWLVPLSFTMIASAMAAEIVGALFGGATTVTSNAPLAVLPSASCAVTVMVAVPSATPDTVSVDWSADTDTVAAASSDDEAVMVSASSSASLNTPDIETSCVASISSPLTSAMAEATTGAAFTDTLNVSSTVPPWPSFAVAVMFAVPRDLADTVNVE